MKEKTYSNQEYTLSIKKRYRKGEKPKITCDIAPNDLLRHCFSVNSLPKVINSIICLLFKEREGIVGTETSIGITLLNSKTEKQGYETRNLLSNRNDVLSCSIHIVNCITSGDTKKFIALDVRFKFYVNKIEVGKGMYEIYSSKYILE